jgi:hypothetical protein
VRGPRFLVNRNETNVHPPFGQLFTAPAWYPSAPRLLRNQWDAGTVPNERVPGAPLARFAALPLLPRGATSIGV